MGLFSEFLPALAKIKASLSGASAGHSQKSAMPAYTHLDFYKNILMRIGIFNHSN
jgi:hypothetical protein